MRLPGIGDSPVLKCLLLWLDRSRSEISARFFHSVATVDAYEEQLQELHE